MALDSQGVIKNGRGSDCRTRRRLGGIRPSGTGSQTGRADLPVGTRSPRGWLDGAPVSNRPQGGRPDPIRRSILGGTFPTDCWFEPVDSSIREPSLNRKHSVATDGTPTGHGRGRSFCWAGGNAIRSPNSENPSSKDSFPSCPPSVFTPCFICGSTASIRLNWNHAGRNHE